jgi:hypothetical protein
VLVLMFVRSKKIKGNQYYYVVESLRRDGVVEQKVRAYLGSYKNAKQQIKLLYRNSRDFGKLLNRLEELNQQCSS